MNVPKLRFKEFDGEWEERKLKDLTESISYGMNASAKEYDGENIYLRITDIDEESRTFIEKGKVSPDGELTEKYLLKENDILFTRTGASTGKSFLFKNEKRKFYFAGFLIRARIKKDVDAKFVYQQTLISKYYKWVKVMSMRSGQPGINGEEYGSFNIFLPSLNEQTRISSFLEIMDKKIQLQQQKIDLLKEQKKGFMQKIFSQELRFKDEDGQEFPEWATIPTGELGEIVTGTTPNTKEKSYYQNGKFPWVTPTDIIQKNIYLTPRKLTEMGIINGRLLPKNTILVTCIASIGKNAILKEAGSCNQQINAIICNENFHYEFVYYLMEKNKIKLHSLAGQGTMPIVNKETFSKMLISVACIEEQKKIGEFLSTIDKKIEKQEIYLKELNNQKQAFMQQMFI